VTILDKIIAHKRQEVARRQRLVPRVALEEELHFNAPTLSLKEYLARPNSIGIIAELKRKSPSKGLLRQDLSVEEISISYMQHGASALSVLTDQNFFGGSYDDLRTARLFNLCPILCKDFVIDEYQLYEARAFGADVILLIAAVLQPAELEHLAGVAQQLGLEVLLELHTEQELQSLPKQQFDFYGINSRDLKDFSVDVERALALAALLPAQALKIAESGIDSPVVLAKLKQAGFNGFLIGEYFMRANNPGRACSQLIAETRKLVS
jgi:indole-3-glycerol phosphate synthase